ncbi:MAG: YheO domain protein [Clostridiales bacterium]|jgi:predicted transcriptional regulator YheO|nr:YheO domain protein [Clostridiales bacterium]
MTAGFDVHPKLQEFFPIAKSIADTFGNNCEVVVHDFKYPEKSLVYIAGNVTGRKLGAPITNLVLETLKKRGNDAPNLIGYKTSTKDGKILKSSTIFIRDDNGKIIGCMCLNLNITDLVTCKEILEKFIKINDTDENFSKEEFYVDVNEALETIIKNVLKDYHTPIQLMEKDDKLYVVKKLDEKGVFLVKGAVDQVASVLGVSRYTIYNYLEEVRTRLSTGTCL